MNSKSDAPAYVRVSLNLITIALIATALYLGRSVLLPLFFSIFLAMVLHPLVNLLNGKKLDRVVAILVCLILSFCLIATVVYFLSTQIGNFLDDIPTLKQRLKELEGSVKEWIHANFNIGLREQTKYIAETTQKMSEQSPGFVQQTFLTLTEIVSYVIFLPVYTFLILYHKDLIKRALTEMFKRSEEDKIAEVLDESQAICQQYLTGMLIEVVIVFTLNSIGFLILGIKYPIFLALVAALLNIVPYIGMLIANIFCVLITLVSSDPSINVLWVFGVLGAVQIIDNNILMPFIVGSKIKINALAIILGVVIGGSLCGVPGMFLAIPGLAIMKIVFEHVDGLKPFAILMGDETTAKREYKNPLKSILVRASKRATKKKQD
jgi:predicted PurR-regulated permease PerM